MIQRSKEVHVLNFLNNKYRFFKEWLRTVTNCWYVTDLIVDELNQVVTFKKVYKISGIKMKGEKTMETLWEEEPLEHDRVKITIYVRERETNEEREV